MVRQLLPKNRCSCAYLGSLSLNFQAKASFVNQKLFHDLLNNCIFLLISYTFLYIRYVQSRMYNITNNRNMTLPRKRPDQPLGKNLDRFPPKQATTGKFLPNGWTERPPSSIIFLLLVTHSWYSFHHILDTNNERFDFYWISTKRLFVAKLLANYLDQALKTVNSVYCTIQYWQ